MRIRGGRWGWVAAVGASVAGCIPEPVLRPRDAGGSADLPAVTDAALTDVASVDVAAVDVAAVDVVEAPDVAADAGALDADGAGAADAGEDAPDATASDVVMDAGSCDPGFVRRGGGCVAVAAARPMWPMSTQTATHRRPMFRWRLGAEADGARVELCRDRVCAAAVGSFVATGSAGQPAEDLPPGPVFWRVWARAGAAEALRPSATWEVYIPWRSGSVNTAQRDTVDVNGDGYADIVVGVPERREVRVYFGSATGPRPAVTMTDPGIDPTAMVLARGGDANGDGRTDVIVQNGSGSARLYYGTVSGYSASSRTDLSGSVTSDAAVVYMWSEQIGDINGDGFSDVASSLTTPPQLEGSASIRYGSGAGVPMFPTLSLPRLSLTVLRPMGDIDGDGFEDIATAGNLTPGGASGGAYAMHGSLGIPPWGPIGTTVRPSVDFFRAWGRADFNGDGIPDMTTRGLFAVDRIPIILGSRGGLESPAGYVGTGDGSRTSASAVADLNADGLGDIALEARGVEQVVLYLGTRSGFSSDPSARIAASGYQRGVGLSTPGDVDGDGFGDVLVARSTETGYSLQLIRGGPQASSLALTAAFDSVPLSAALLE